MRRPGHPGAPLNNAIAEQRLRNQFITRAGPREPADVVAWLGAVQAQEYPVAKWALALRMRDGTTDAEIERAFDDGRILRTHVMRPTWHFVTASDIRWMLELTAPHEHRAMASYNRKLGLDAATFNRALSVFERALSGGAFLTRVELGTHLERAGIAANSVTLARMTLHAELEALICSGPRRGRQFTYALLAERAPSARRLPRDEALAELTGRYFRSHGPATIRDFVWWSGLTAADTRRGLEMNRARSREIDGLTYWTVGRAGRTRGAIAQQLPVYDEYLIAYRDRDAVPHWAGSIQTASRGSVTFQHAVIINGQVAGTWKTIRSKRGVTVDLTPLRRLTSAERSALGEAAARYGRFLEVPVSLVVRTDGVRKRTSG